MIEIAQEKIVNITGGGVCFCRNGNQLLGGWELAPDGNECQIWCCSGAIGIGLGLKAEEWSFGTNREEAKQNSHPCPSAVIINNIDIRLFKHSNLG